MTSRFKPPILPAAFSGIVPGPAAGLGNAWPAAYQVWPMPAVVGEALMALPPPDSGRRNHFIWPSNLAAPLALFDSRSSASRPPAA